MSGGNGALPAALAARHEVRYHHVVERVEPVSGGVLVRHTTGGQRSTERFDACVIATPASLSLSLHPAMCGVQKRFFEAIRFTSAICIHLALSARPDNREMLLMFPECEDGDVAAVYLNHNKVPGRAPAGPASSWIPRRGSSR